MKKKKIDSFCVFLLCICALILFLFFRLFLGMQDEKKTYTTLVPLGDLAYDSDFLKNTAKIKGIREIYPVAQIPVTLKIEDYTESTTFYGIDFNAFAKNPAEDSPGNTPILLLGKNSLANMKDSNGHQISKKQQEKYLQMGEKLSIAYSLKEAAAPDSLTSAASTWLPCRAAAVLKTQDTEIYIPISQAKALCQAGDTPLSITSVLLKINGKENLENARQLFQ